jgi:DNA-binding protein HU-beta
MRNRSWIRGRSPLGESNCDASHATSRTNHAVAETATAAKATTSAARPERLKTSAAAIAAANGKMPSARSIPARCRTIRFSRCQTFGTPASPTTAYLPAISVTPAPPAAAAAATSSPATITPRSSQWRRALAMTAWARPLGSGATSATARIAVSATGKRTINCTRAAVATKIVPRSAASFRALGLQAVSRIAQTATRQSGYAAFSLIVNEE